MNELIMAIDGLALIMVTVATHQLSTWLERWDYERHRKDGGGMRTELILEMSSSSMLSEADGADSQDRLTDTRCCGIRRPSTGTAHDPDRHVVQ